MRYSLKTVFLLMLFCCFSAALVSDVMRNWDKVTLLVSFRMPASPSDLINQSVFLIGIEGALLVVCAFFAGWTLSKITKSIRIS